MEYNTTRNGLTMREYGRHVQKMIEHVLTIEDSERRQRNAHAALELMGFLNPHLRNVDEFKHKLWDHLFLISNFKLDIQSPYPVPTRESLSEKPQPLPYPKRKPKHNHLGKNIELIIDKALSEENEEKRAGFANIIAYYMKLSYNNWHKESTHDDTIQSELSSITNGQLTFTNTPSLKSIRHSDARDNREFGKPRGKFQPSRGGNGGGGGGGQFRNDRSNSQNGNNKYKKKRY